MDIDLTAPVIVELETTVRASLERVWALHTGVDAWPGWNAAISTARLREPLAVGAVFDWETHGLVIASTIAEIAPLRRIVWGGPAHGIDGVHVWTFEQVDGAVVVRTRESWAGAPVEGDPEGMRAALDASLRSWLDALKAAAESPETAAAHTATSR
ncbi:SRPBCC family protein [Nonomuraea basaltis]|uniref:SRPBCC family protein n=1 Tax=Nonomuraea basaltis TaxID=2495887 RepID=UPI00110C48BC|nr:SRPBCC family protein [Nonomuraea basaltis]TMR93701.1 Shy6-polyketide cyclase [Nonomuraea basaltis]